jgi:hypothetical protein
VGSDDDETELVRTTSDAPAAGGPEEPPLEGDLLEDAAAIDRDEDEDEI